MNIISSKNKNNRKACQMLGLAVVAAVAINMIPDLSFADDTADVFSNTLCRVVNWFTGRTGKAVATMAVIFLGIAAFFGKVTWGLALMFAVGIFAIFGAAEIVNAVGNTNNDTQNTKSCSNTNG